MVMHNLVSFTLVAAVDAIRGGLPLRSRRFQVDPALVVNLLAGVSALGVSEPSPPEERDGSIRIDLEPSESLNAVAQSVERQYFLSLFRQTGGDFKRMAEILLGDESRSRAVRLRFNQLGLKVRELRP